MSTLGKLNRLKINGYKSIKSIDIEFSSINILIGANGVGKSNFIGFFKFVKKLIDKELELYIGQLSGANKVLHFGRRVTKELNFSLLFSPNGYEATLIPDDTNGLIFKTECGYFFADKIGYVGGTKTYPLSNIGTKESNLPNKAHKSSPTGHIVGYIQDWKVYHFHDTSKASAMKQPCNINDYCYFREDGGNLPAFLYSIKMNNELSYRKIIKTIQRVAPFFQDFILEPDVNNNDMIRLRWKHKGSDLYFDANDLSDGTIRFICLVTLLLQPNLPTIILLDEPELGLHPFALEILASLFRVVSNKTQIIASTQSVTFADYFDIEDIIVADTQNYATTLKKIDTVEYKKWIEEYTVGDLWQKNVIGGVPCYD